MTVDNFVTCHLSCNRQPIPSPPHGGQKTGVGGVGLDFLAQAGDGVVEPTLILESFQKGADGVLVLACHPGDCHYKEGNLRAYCRAELLERLVPQLGVDPRRFRFDYVSAAEADRFSQITNEFVDQVRALAVRPFKN